MIEQVDHIGIAVKALEGHLRFYRDVLKLELQGIEEVPDQKVRVAVFRAGEATIELLEPTAPDSPISRFLENRGEGIHHIAYRVDDVEAELARLKAANVRLIDSTPRAGAGGKRIAFLHPAASLGVLTELCGKSR